jgi:hypothetical protein
LKFQAFTTTERGGGALAGSLAGFKAAVLEPRAGTDETPITSKVCSA